MDRISGLSDDLLVKILSFVPTKVAVSTSILSKRWECLWMWVPKLEYHEFEDITDIYYSMPSFLRYRVSVNKNLLSHRAPIIESLRLRFCVGSLQPEDIKLWVGFAVSRYVRVLSIRCFSDDEPDIVLPCSLYTCKSLVTLKLEGDKILVDVPPTVCLPSLKTLQLLCVAYLNEDSLRLLLSYCLVLEDLVIKRDGYEDHVEALVVIVPSLQRLSLQIHRHCLSDGYVIDTPSLKYFKVVDYRYSSSYLIKHMPKLEEADISVQKDVKQFLESITCVKRLSLKVNFNNEKESMYCDCIVFNELEHLKLSICSDYWSKLLVRLLNDSPKLRVLNISVHQLRFWNDDQIDWDNDGSLIPKCLLKTLETFQFAGCKGTPEERDFFSYILKHARCLKFTSILS